jgi:hypothetical protein
MVEFKAFIDSMYPVKSRTSPSSGQATISFQLRHPKLLACHSGQRYMDDRAIVAGLT